MFFETDQEGKAEPVPAEAVAALLAEHRIPVAVLNACQSAMQSDSEAGLAQQLAEAGVPVAVGMAYSVTVSAAERAMPVLYRRLADGADLAAAVHAARRELHEHQARQAYFGQQLDLEDWMLPVMFGQQPPAFELRPMTDAEQARFYERQAEVGDEPATEYGFVGRDLDIQAIERRLLAGPDSNELLVQGMAGAGKSTLLAHLAWWWQRTGLVDEVFRFSYEDRAWTAQPDHPRHPLPAADPGRACPRRHHVRRRRRRSRSPGCCARPGTCSILDNAESITAAPAAIPHALDPGRAGQAQSSAVAAARRADPGPAGLPRSRDLAHRRQHGPGHLPAARPGPASRLAAGGPDPGPARRHPLARRRRRAGGAAGPGRHCWAATRCR